jgi:hypothetical protein
VSELNGKIAEIERENAKLKGVEALGAENGGVT